MIRGQLELRMANPCPKLCLILYPTYVGVSGRKFESDISIPREMVRNTLRSLAFFSVPLAVFPPAALSVTR